MQSTIDASLTTSVSWLAQGASSCSATGDWTGSKESSGTEMVGPLYRDTNLGLTCSGPGGSVSRDLAISVRPILVTDRLPSVIALGDAATSLLVSQSETQLTFNAPISLQVGNVFVLDEIAYKVTGTQFISGQMIVDFVMPELHEIFEKVRIAGSFSSDPQVALATDANDPSSLFQEKMVPFQGQQASGSGSVPFSISNGLMTASGVFAASFETTVDVDFTVLDGLKKADFHADVTSSIRDGSIGISLGVAPPFVRRIATFRVPIGLTGAVIQIPLSAAAGVSSDMEMTSRMSSSLRTVADVRYSEGAGISGGISFPSRESQFSVSSLAGATSVLQPGLSLDLLLQVRPMLQLLGYPLVGVEIGVGPGVRISGRLEGASLCGQLTGSGIAKGRGLVKGFGRDYSTNEVSTTFGSLGNVSIGACRTASMVTLTIPQGVQAYKGTAVNVTVTVAKSAPGAPPVEGPPTGMVTIKLDGEECVAQLFNGTGSCAVIPTLALARTITATYIGDTVYSAATATAAVDVGFRSATAQFNTSGSVTFTLPVAPGIPDLVCTSPLNASHQLTLNLEGSPSAAISFNASGATNCPVTVQGGSGQFTIPLSRSGNQYSGEIGSGSNGTTFEANMTESGFTGSMSSRSSGPVNSTNPNIPPGSANGQSSGNFTATGH